MKSHENPFHSHKKIAPKRFGSIAMRPFGCDTFVALPPSTPEGLVVFGKNSDRPRGEGQSLQRYARQRHPPGMLRLLG